MLIKDAKGLSKPKGLHIDVKLEKKNTNAATPRAHVQGATAPTSRELSRILQKTTFRGSQSSAWTHSSRVKPIVWDQTSRDQTSKELVNAH